MLDQKAWCKERFDGGKSKSEKKGEVEVKNEKERNRVSTGKTKSR